MPSKGWSDEAREESLRVRRLRAMMRRYLKGGRHSVNLLPVVKMRTMDEVFEDAVERPRFLAMLLVTFAGIALLLAAALSQGICAGEIYRCTAANGDVMFTNLACPSNSQVQHVASYVPEPYSPEPVVDVAAEAAARSAREAQEAAAQAQTAYLSAQTAYLQAAAAAESAEAEGYQRANDNNGYPMWIASYPFIGRHGSRHGGGHDGRHRHHGGEKSDSPMLPYPPTLPINTSWFARQR